MSTIERYSIRNNRYDLLDLNLKIPVYGCIALLASDQKLLIAGGFNTTRGAVNNVFTIHLSNGCIEDYAPLKESAWTAMPPFYKHGNLSYFTDSEEGDSLPNVKHYPLFLPLV